MTQVPSTESTALTTPIAPNVLQRALRYAGVVEIPLAELRARYEGPKSSYIDVDGTQVHCQVDGQGPPLILLHGVLAQLQTWDAWTEQLKAHFTVYRMDLPGFGLTGPMASGNYSPEYALKFFEMARVALGLERASIAGSSLGGFLGWFYAARYPELVDKLIVIDPLSYGQKAPAVMRFASSPVIRSFVPNCVPRPFIDASLRQIYADPSRIAPNLGARYHELLLRSGNRAAMLAYFDQADRMFATGADGRGEFSREIPNIQCPVMVMWGDQDPWVPVEHVQAFKKDLPNVQVKVYPGVGHLPMEEVPELSVRDAIEFLQG